MNNNPIKIVLYDHTFEKELEALLISLSQELFGEGTVSIEDFVNNHWSIYLAVRDSKVIGLSSFVHNTYFGLRPPTIGNSYLYVLPEHRGSRATYLLSLQSGYISDYLQLPLENYYASEESKKISRKLNGTKAYETYIYEVEEVNRVFKNLKSKVNIRN